MEEKKKELLFSPHLQSAEPVCTYGIKGRIFSYCAIHSCDCFIQPSVALHNQCSLSHPPFPL